MIISSLLHGYKDYLNEEFIFCNTYYYCYPRHDDWTNYLNIGCSVGNIVPVKLRNIKAIWSIEAEQDLTAFHNIEAAHAIANAIQMEIDAEIIRDLRGLV